MHRRITEIGSRDEPASSEPLQPPTEIRRTGTPERRPKADALGPARQVHGAAAMLAVSVLVDSAIEHYRGQFHNPAMVLPLLASAASLIASADGAARNEAKAHGVRLTTYGAALGIGALGTGFHLYNVLKKPGGLRWENLFYQAPLGAPAALSLCGLLGLSAELIRDTPKGRPPKLAGLPAGQGLAWLVSAGLLGTVGEVGLLHFRGNFQNPAMYIPVILPPVAAALTAHAALNSSPRPRPKTKLWLGLTAIMGIAGVGFHAYGVSRAMGGWRNWRQTLIDGPPLPAPPSFSGLALAGIAALRLLEGVGHE